MKVAYYRLSVALAASLSLMLVACGSPAPSQPAAGQPAAASEQKAATNPEDDDIDTEATIWTVLGLAKRQSQRQPGPQTGVSVSPILWQATLDTLDFVKLASEDPLGGSLITEWYSPNDKPNERYKVTVFILARALRSDSIAVTVDRQERSATGQWTDTTIARKVSQDLETAILKRARQLRRAWAKIPS